MPSLNRQLQPTSRSLPGLILLLAATIVAPAFAQEDELPLEALPGLTTQKSLPKKALEKKKPVKAKTPRESAAQSGIDAGGAIIASPPGESARETSAIPLAEVPLLNLSTRIAVIFVRTPLVDEATATDLESGLRGVAFLAPLSQNPTVLRPALDAPESSICQPDEDICFLNMAAWEGADSVAVATLTKSAQGLTVRVRRLSLQTRRPQGDESADSPNDRVALKAQTESLLCKLLVPAGCTNEIQIDTSGADILYAGRVLPRGSYLPMRVTLPVGLAPLSARHFGRSGPSRLVPVLREKMSGIAMSVRLNRDGTPLMLTPGEAETYRPAPLIATVKDRSAPGSNWHQPAGFAVAGAGGALLIAGIIEGLHSKSLLSDARTAYNSNGGAYRPADLDGLNSGNSAAHTANILYLAGALVAAAGLTLALAF